MQLKQLLVVIDPTSKGSQPSLERATWLATKSKAAVELLVCDHNPALEDGFFTDKEAQKRARTALLAERLDWLEELAAPLREQGLTVTTKVRWGKPLYTEILKHVEELKPDLLLRNATTHGVLHRLLFNNTSWQLIRFCPVPLWLVRDGDWNPTSVATALDPMHSADKPASLDHLLIKVTRLIGAELNMQEYFLHCYAPLPKSLVFEAEMVVSYDSYLANAEQHHKEAFDKLLAQYDVEPKQRHLLKGITEETIPQFVKDNDVDLLVMGAISRGNIENALIGNTAERILEASDCDLLVIKPMPNK